MEKIADTLTRSFLKRGFIDEEQTEWCQYILESRLTTALSILAFLVVGAWIAGLPEAIVFIYGVASLRRRTNGYHAHTFWQCMLQSLLCEIIAFSLLPFLPAFASPLLLIVSSAVILPLAPANSSRMHFTPEEIHALQNRARIQVLLLDGAALILSFVQPRFAACLALSLAMVAILLVLAKLGFGEQ